MDERERRRSARIYILGLNQPNEGVAPLFTEPPGCAGHRLWRMVYEVCGISAGDWLLKTQRCNLLPFPELPRGYRNVARDRGEALAPMIENRTVVLVGWDVATAMGHGQPPLRWANGRDWVMIPHTSGLDRWYNNPVHRIAVGTMLADLLAVWENSIAPDARVG